MKKVNLFLVALIALFTVSVGVSSCSKDDDDKKGGTTDIVGLWKFSTVTTDIVNPTNPELAAEEEEGYALSVIFLQESTAEFKSDKTFIMTIDTPFGADTETGTYSVNGKNVTLIPDSGTEMDDMTDGTVTIENDKLIFQSSMLDNVYNEDEGDETYRDLGFTKFDTKMIFKK